MAVTAAAPWLPRLVAAVPVSIAIGALAAFALGGAVVGILLPQLVAAIAVDEGGTAGTLTGVAAAGVSGLVLIGFLHGMPRGRPMEAAAATGRWLLIAGIGGWLGYLLLSPTGAAGGPDRLPRGRLAGDRPMSVTVDTELAVLLDVGSAWAKASIIGRVRGRWRLVTHVAQPTAWGSAELRQELLDRLIVAMDPRLAGRAEELLASANRIECHTAAAAGPPRRGGGLAGAVRQRRQADCRGGRMAGGRSRHAR